MKLHDYQQRAVDWMNDRERGFIWLGMGDGKTVIAATSILQGVPAIVVGTKRIIENVWPAELKKWPHLNSLSYSACVGAKPKRIKAVQANPDVLGVSYENLAWLVESGGMRGRQLLIFDEVSKMKSHATKRFRSLLRMKNGPTRIFGLTATPSMEGYDGLFAQWKSVGGDDRLGRNITEFRKLFCQERFRGNYSEFFIDKRAKGKIERLLAPDVFTIDDRERPYTSDPLIVDVPIPWGSKQALDTYKTMEKQLIAELSGGKSFAVASRGVAMNKCRQMATGFVYDEARKGIKLDDEKFSAIVEAYEELQGDPVLIFYQFEYERDVLLAQLPGSQPLGDDNYEAFNRGEIPALVLHPSSCSHGLNLQGARYVFWSTLPQSGEQYFQANGRIDRQGQNRQPIIKRFLRTGSADEDSRDMIEGKVTDNQTLIERIRERNA